MLISDKPINCLDEDRLHRKSFAKHLAQAIVSYTSEDNFTIGLCGKWGTGKTSIINMVVEEINSLTEQDINKPIIVMFNPWNYSDKTQLINQFFQTILLRIGAKTSNKNLKRVGSALQKYAGIFEYSQYIPFVGKYLKPIKSVVSNVGKGISDVAKNKESLESLKNNVIDALRKQDQKIIVIIDDIDRLNNEQIRLIFQLVNCVAGFPNMIYLLSFDKSIVARALEDEQKCKGEEYLEKIIQVPFDVPDAKKSDVHKLLFDQLDSLWFDQMPCDSFEKEYWNNIYNSCLAPLINTIRDVNRVMNVYKLKYGLLYAETNCIDLLAITVLQVCAPGIFYWVKDNISKLTGSSYSISVSRVDQNKYQEEMLEEFKNVTDNAQIMIQALQAMFPKFSLNTGGYYANGETEDELRRKQKISCADRAPLYFRLSLEDICVPNKLVVDSINNYNSADLDRMVNDLIKDNLVSQYTKELNVRVNDIPDNRKQLILQKLIKLQAMSFEDKEEGFLYISPAYYCEHCCWAILKTMNKEETFKAFKEYIKSLSDDQFVVVIKMIVQIEKAFARIGESHNYDYRVISEDQLISLEEPVLARLKEMSKDCFLFRSEDPWTQYCFWDYKEPDSLQNYMNEGLNNKDNIPYYIFARVLTWMGGKTHGWYYNKEDIEKHISIDKVYEDLLALKNTDSFSNLEYDIKETTVAFYLWYNSDREDDYSITKQKVDSLIPEWEKTN